MAAISSLPHLVDLSIGTPEVGAVNFTALHQLLHSIVDRLNISELNPDIDKVFPAHGTTSTVAATKWKALEALQSKVASIEHNLEVFYPKLPNAKEMSDLVTSDRPIADFWQFLSLTKQIEANASGLQAAMDLIQEIFNQLKTFHSSLDELKAKSLTAEDVSESNNKIGKLMSKMQVLEFEVDHMSVIKEFIGEDHLPVRIPHVDVINEPQPVTAQLARDRVPSNIQPIVVDELFVTPIGSLVPKVETAVQHKDTSTKRMMQVLAMPKVSEIVDQLANLQATVDRYPLESEVVTWTELEGALNGTHNVIIPLNKSTSVETSGVKKWGRKEFVDVAESPIPEVDVPAQKTAVADVASSTGPTIINHTSSYIPGVTPAAPSPGSAVTPAAPSPGSVVTPTAPSSDSAATPTAPSSGSAVTPAAPSLGSAVTPAAPSPGSAVTPAAPSPGSAVIAAAPFPGSAVISASPSPASAATPAAPSLGSAVTPAAPSPGSAVTPAAPSLGSAVTPAAPSPGSAVTPAAPSSGSAVTPAAPSSGSAVTPAAPSPGSAVTPAAPSPGSAVTPAAPSSGSAVTPAAPSSGSAVTAAAPSPVPAVADAAPSPGPTEDCVHLLEKLGSADQRINQLTDQVQQLNKLVNDTRQPIIEGLTKIPEDLIKQLDHLESLATRTAEIDDLRAKLNDLEVLLSDIPEACDERLPPLGDKSKLSLEGLHTSRVFSESPHRDMVSGGRMAGPHRKTSLVPLKTESLSSKGVKRLKKRISKSGLDRMVTQSLSSAVEDGIRPTLGEVRQGEDNSTAVYGVEREITDTQATDGQTPSASDLGIAGANLKKSPGAIVGERHKHTQLRDSESRDSGRRDSESRDSQVEVESYKDVQLEIVDQLQRESEPKLNDVSQIAQSRDPHRSDRPSKWKLQEIFAKSGALQTRRDSAALNDLPATSSSQRASPTHAVAATSSTILDSQSFTDSHPLVDGSEVERASSVADDVRQLRQDSGKRVQQVSENLPPRHVDKRKLPAHHGKKFTEQMKLSDNQEDAGVPTPTYSHEQKKQGAKALTHGAGSSATSIAKVKDQPIKYDAGSASEVSRATESHGRFNHTLREVVQKDYMPEIKRLQVRVDRLENRPVYQMQMDDNRVSNTGMEAGKIRNVVDKLDSLKEETNRHVKQMDNQLRSVLDQGPGDDALRRTQIAIGDLQAQLTTLRALTLQMKMENDYKTAMINEMKQDFARLDEEKVDSNTLATELDHKADIIALQSKSDKSALDMLTFDLQRLIDDLLGKLVSLEDAWRKVHMKLESDVEKKANDENLMQLKQAVEDKMRKLHQHLKKQQKLLLPTADEAALLRRKLPFNCLSCDKPVAGYQYCVGDNLKLSKLGPHTVHYSQSEIEQLQKQVVSPRSTEGECISLSRLKKRNLKAYMVQLSQDQPAKVFITRSKHRSVMPGVADLYAKPRSCGGKHTITQHKLQGQIIIPGKNQSLRDIFVGEEFVAAGVLNQEEEDINGADGRPYKSRVNTIEIDKELTEAMLANRDPLLPMVEEISHRNRPLPSKGGLSKKATLRSHVKHVRRQSMRSESTSSVEVGGQRTKTSKELRSDK